MKDRLFHALLFALWVLALGVLFGLHLGSCALAPASQPEPELGVVTHILVEEDAGTADAGPPRTPRLPPTPEHLLQGKPSADFRPNHTARNIAGFTIIRRSLR